MPATPQPATSGPNFCRLRAAIAIVAAVALGFPAVAAEVDSHAYSCADLHALINANRWIFITNPDFEDIVVADARECSLADQLDWRSVPTTDIPECIVYHCLPLRRPG